MLVEKKINVGGFEVIVKRCEDSELTCELEGLSGHTPLFSNVLERIGNNAVENRVCMYYVPDTFTSDPFDLRALFNNICVADDYAYNNNLNKALRVYAESNGQVSPTPLFRSLELALIENNAPHFTVTMAGCCYLVVPASAVKIDSQSASINWLVFLVNGD